MTVRATANQTQPQPSTVKGAKSYSDSTQVPGASLFSDAARPGPVYTTPRFETGDPRYAWLNKIQAVMKGRSNGRTLIAYRMYEVV